MDQPRKKTVTDLMEGMTDDHRRMVAEGIATMHRFSAEPTFTHGKPRYKGNTVAAIAHAKATRGS